MKIKVKYLSDISPLKYITGGDWIDLRTAEEVNMAKGEFGCCNSVTRRL